MKERLAALLTGAERLFSPSALPKSKPPGSRSQSAVTTTPKEETRTIPKQREALQRLIEPTRREEGGGW